MPQLELFTIPDTFPAEDLDRMIACNSASGDWENKPSFYALKSLILRHYAEEVGYDLQKVKKPCWTCYGTGRYTHISGTKDCCNRCMGSGVYSIEEIVLRRWSLNGHLFHTVVGNLRYLGGWVGSFNDTIKGTIKHDPPRIDHDEAYQLLKAKYMILAARPDYSQRP